MKQQQSYSRASFRPALIGFAGGLLVLILLATGVLAQSGVELPWHVFGSAGVTTASSGGSVTLSGTLGQPAVGPSAGGNVTLIGGFWNAELGVTPDTTPPDTSITAQPADPSNSDSAGFEFTGTDDVTPAGALTFECVLDLGKWAACTSPKEYTGLSDGSHTFQVVALDAAGNRDPSPASHTWVIDTIAPAASPAQSPAANASGWNNTDVLVAWNWAENGSGIDGANCTIGTTSAGEGELTLTATCRDLAGNTGSAQYTLKVDKTSPGIALQSHTPAPNAAGWHNGDVTLTWACTDGGSGVVAATDSATITGEGADLAAQGACADLADNTATDTQSGIKIDRTAPSTSVSGPGGWQNGSVTLTLDASDALAGVAATSYILDGGATQTGTSVAISSDGVHTLEFWSVDHAGNAEAHHTAEVHIDQTGPGISHTQEPAANGSGWNNAAVTVTFTCTDTGSGIASCTGPQTVSTEGEGQVVTGTAVDNAGNSVDDLATINLDLTPPAISAAADRPANAAGWYNADVLVSFTCDDALSGVASCPAAQTLGEGADQSAGGTALDAADNSASTALSDINIDKTAPTLSGAATSAPNAAGWYNGDVTVAWTCSDALSGIDGACPADSVVAGEGDGLSASAAVADVAGNSTTATVGDIKIDRTPPSIVASATVDGDPYTASTWTDGDVVVSFACTDGLSGMLIMPLPVTVSSEGAGQSVTGTCGDRAGNTASATFGDINIDQTAPALAPSVAPNPVVVGGAAAASANATDALSGVASQGCDVVATGSAGAQTVACTATDHAGNSAGGSAGYTVINPPAATDRFFDFNAGGSPAQAGYTGVQPGDVYPGAGGYGWDTALVSSGGSYQGAFDRGAQSGAQGDLRRDGHWSQYAHTFKVDVANGRYWVNVTVGDASFPRDRLQVRAEGAVQLASVTTAAGQWLAQGFWVDVSDNQLSLEFSDGGGDPYWVLNGLAIRSIGATATGPGGISFSRSGANLDADGVTLDTIAVSGPAGALVTVTASVGTIASTDASTAYAGFQVAAGGSFQFRHPATPGVLNLAGASVDGSATGESLAAATYTLPVAGLAFDLNGGTSSPTQAGHIGVLPSAAYSAAAGYGWDTALVSSGGSYQGGFDRGTQSGALAELRQDGHWSQSAHTFKVDVPDGRYWVAVTLGDASFPRDRIQVKAEGAVVLANVTTAGQWLAQGFVVDVQDGQLSLEVSDLGGDPYWVLNGLRVVGIAQGATGPGGLTFTLTPDGTAADGAAEDTIAVSGPAGALVTVTASVGAIVGTDASAAYGGFQVAAGGSFQLRHPAAPGVLDLAGMTVDGAASGASPAAAAYTLPAVRKFDFNGPGNFTATGYIGVRGGATYSAALGYGWAAAVPEFERSTSDALKRDGHYGAQSSPGTFKVVVAQGQAYNVTVIVGDAWYPRDRIRITVEGAAPYTVASLAAGQFYTHVATGVSATDDVLTVTIEDLGGDPYWVVNAVEVAQP